VQAVYRVDDRRILAGRIETGRIAVGDEIALVPSGQTARVRSFEAWPDADHRSKPRAADAGRSVGITLDRELFVERGDMLCAAVDPATAARRLTARIFWLHDEPLTVGDTVTVRVGAAQTHGTIATVRDAIDPGQLAPTAASVVARNNVADVEIVLAAPVATDSYERNPRTGRVVIGHA